MPAFSRRARASVRPGRRRFPDGPARAAILAVAAALTTVSLAPGSPQARDAPDRASPGTREMAALLREREALVNPEALSLIINDRRADPRYQEVWWMSNGAHAYYDAAKVTLSAPRWKGLNLNAAYWFAKAIDTGADYTSRASGRDAYQYRSQSEFDFVKEMKSLSNFDQPNAFQLNVSYETPFVGRRNGWLDQIFGQWQVATVLLAKSGVPFAKAAAAAVDRTTSAGKPDSAELRASARLNARKSIDGSGRSTRNGSTTSRVTGRTDGTSAESVTSMAFRKSCANAGAVW